jgi:hypothetical protein
MEGFPTIPRARWFEKSLKTNKQPNKTNKLSSLIDGWINLILWLKWVIHHIGNSNVVVWRVVNFFSELFWIQIIECENNCYFHMHLNFTCQLVLWIVLNTNYWMWKQLLLSHALDFYFVCSSPSHLECLVSKQGCQPMGRAPLPSPILSIV